MSRRSERTTTARFSALGVPALDEFGGPLWLLDRDQRVVLSTPGADALLGFRPSLGERAPRLLCGRSEERPIAEALARGAAAHASIQRTSPRGTESFLVQAVPLSSEEGVVGHALSFRKEESVEGERYGIVTRSDSMRRLLHQLKRISRSNSAVLVRGETGSGKELVARAIHEESPRRSGPFLAINCAALPVNLLESELFGHVRGAFTGAVRDTPGYFRKAHGGTLFLDEIAELPLALQAKLLRVTQERVIVPVGGTAPISVDVRIVSATHRSLRQEVEQGRFRADLMYRLRVLPLFLPPLRVRPDDIELLAERFLEKLNRSVGGRRVERLAPGALRALVRYAWPGNVRELESALEYAFMLGEGTTLTEAELPDEVRGRAVDAEPPPRGFAEIDPSLPEEARRLLVALGRADGSRERAARSLGMSRTTLWRKLKSYGLDGA